MSFLRVTNDKSTDRVNGFKVPRFYKSYQNVAPFLRSQYRNSNSTGGTGSATNGTTFIWPLHQKGDIAFIIIETNTASNPTPPSGWASIPDGNKTNDSTSPSKAIVWYRVCASSTETNPVIPVMTNHQIGSIIVFGGVSQASHSLPVTAYNVRTTNSTTCSYPSITTRAPNSRVIMMAFHGVSTTTPNINPPTSSQLTGITEHIDTATTSGDGGGFGVYSGIAPNVGTVTLAGSGGWSERWITYVIALEPSTALPSP